MKNVLITGASGMLGATLAEKMSYKFKVFGTGNSIYSNAPFNYLQFDLGKEDYSPLIEWSNPDIIIHCAALTNGNYCSNNVELAFNLNGFSMEKLLKFTKQEVKIIYISSDAVFPSNAHLAKETDCVFPESIYGKSKELGEYFLQISSNRKYIIVRTTIVGYNRNKGRIGFVEWIINSAKNSEEIGLFSDVLFTPISIWELIDEIKFLIGSDSFNNETLHIAGELCTKYEFGIRVLRALKLSHEKILKSSIMAFKDRAKRSTDQSLDSNFYQKKYKRILPNLEKTINSIKNHYHDYN